MSNERSVNDIVGNLTDMLVSIAKRENEEEIKKAIETMEEGWAKMDEVLGNTWFNKEIGKIWRENHKND